MKTPITPSDLRIGDKVRTEARDGRPFGTRPQMLASEWIVGEDDLDGDYEGVDLYLLERRAPVVDLPEEPTLGWIAANFGRRLIMTTGDGRGGVDVLDQGYVDSVAIRSFVPAVAVPESALTALRGRIGGLLSVTVLVRRIDTFLAAVDAANGDPR